MKRYAPLIVRGSLLLMESLWVYAFVAWLIAVTVGGDKPSFLGVAVVVFASFGISRGLQNSTMSLGVLRFWGAFLSIIVFYAIVRFDYYGNLQLWDLQFLDNLFNDTDQTLSDGATAVIGVPVLWGFWMRGVLRGQQSVTFEDVLRSFGMGVIIVAFVSLFSGLNDELPRAVDFIAIPYIAIGLLAIGLAHTARASDQFERGFAGHWALFAGGGLLVLGVLAMLFVLIDFDTARDILVFIGGGIGYIVAGIFYIVLWPILKLVELAFIALRFLHDIWGGTQQDPIEDPQGEIPSPEDRPEGESPIPGWVGTVVRVFVAGGLVAVLIAGTALLFSRFRRPTPADETRESTYQEGRLASDLGDLLNSFLGRFRGHHGQAAAQSEPIRRLYFEMLDTAADRGIHRRPMETPLEMVPRINRAFAGPTPADITKAFDDSRYGAIASDEEDVRRLREEWERLQAQAGGDGEAQGRSPG